MQLYDVDEFRASERWPYAISAGCVVYRHGEGLEVILLKREPSHSHNITEKPTYNLPKGHVDFNEALEEAAVRETAEEAGVEAEAQTYLGAKFWDITHPVHKIHVEKTVHYFAAQWKADLESIDTEHDEKVWVSLDDAEKLLGPPNPKGEDEIIRRFQKYLELTK